MNKLLIASGLALLPLAAYAGMISPIISEVSPANGYPGTAVSIIGSGFIECSNCETDERTLDISLGTAASLQITPDNDRVASFTIPDGIPQGVYDITVRNSNGLPSNPYAFTVGELAPAPSSEPLPPPPAPEPAPVEVQSTPTPYVEVKPVLKPYSVWDTLRAKRSEPREPDVVDKFEDLVLEYLKELVITLRASYTDFFYKTFFK